MANTKTNEKLRSAVVGLSGGVDSAVASALLKENGRNIFGRYIKGYALPGIVCPEEDDIRDARMISHTLGINFEVENEGSDLYRKEVYENFVESYFAGKTPNPDIRCNKLVKFPLLKKLKDKCGADSIVTGHYFRKEGNRFFMARDREKDQSYFLWAVPREILLECDFPIGNLTKKEVRAIAKSHNLHVWDKPGTRGVCMVGEISIPEALEEVSRSRGMNQVLARAVLLDGDKEQELGKIPGHVFFAATIGQRNGFGISYRFPIYVSGKDIKNPTLYFSVFPKGPGSFIVSEVNWLAPDAGSFHFPMRLQVKIRTPGKLLSARLVRNGDGFFEVRLDEPDPGVAPGQSAVFYRKRGDNMELLGGGVIQ